MTFSDAAPDTPSGDPAAEQWRRPLTGGAARQARYRAKRQLRSIDVRAETADRITRLCSEMSLPTHAVVAAALDALEERLRPEQAKSVSARRQRPDAEPSPVTLDLFEQVS